MDTRAKTKKQRFRRALERFPIAHVLDMCKPLDREASALVDTAWRDAERKSRQLYWVKPRTAKTPRRARRSASQRALTILCRDSWATAGF